MNRNSCLLLAAALGLAVAVPFGSLLAQEEEFDFDAAAGLEEQQEPEPVEFVPAPITDESAALDPSVEVSVEELIRMAGLSSASIGKEFQENPNSPTAIFADREKVDRMLGDKPRFIYFPQGADPMIIPWVRDEIVAQELLAEVNVANKAHDFEKARSILNKIAGEYAQTDVAKKVPETRELVNKTEAAAKRKTDEPIPGGPPPPNEPSLPRWIEDNTDGIIIGDEPMLIVGTDWLKVGDTVPGYGGVRVKSIAPSEVMYVYEDKEYTVKVVGSF